MTLVLYSGCAPECRTHFLIFFIYDISEAYSVLISTNQTLKADEADYFISIKFDNGVTKAVKLDYDSNAQCFQTQGVSK